MKIDKGFIKRNTVLLKIFLSTVIRKDYRKYRREISFLLKHGLNTYPYKYILNYDLSNEELYKDTNGPYVIHKGRRLYFPDSEKYTEDTILKTHLLSNMEQDIDSPHRYLNVNEDMTDVVFFDIGCQEASLPLEFVDKLKHLYLFEAEEEWNKPLSTSFGDYIEKVSIINKYVSDKDELNEISISNFIITLADKKEIDLSKDRIFIKMDIEGAEERVFADIRKVMDKICNLDIAICLYHKRSTEEDIRRMLPLGYTMRVRDTYMLFEPYGKDFKYPYFRHGVGRIERVPNE